MKFYLKTILLLAITLGGVNVTYAAFGAGLQATSTTQGWVFPLRISNSYPKAVFPSFIATSTTQSSVFPYASTTMLSATTASTTNLIISGISGCSSTSALTTNSSGVVACGAITGSGGAAFAFTPTTNYGVAVNSTTTALWLRAGLMASTTSYFDYATSTALTVTGNAYFPSSGIWNSSGNIGVGLQSPVAQIHISSNAASAKGILITNASANGAAQAAIDFSYNDTAANTRSRIGYFGSTNEFRIVGGGDNLGFITFYTGGSGGVDTASERMRITPLGNVGIGTTSPYAKLSVAGEVVASHFTATSTTATSTVKNALRIGTDSWGSAKTSEMYINGNPCVYTTQFCGMVQISANDTNTSVNFPNSGLYIGVDTSSITAGGSYFLQAWNPYTGVNNAGSLSINPNGGGTTINGIGSSANVTQNLALTVVGNASNNAFVRINSIQNGGYSGVLFRGYNEFVSNQYTKAGIVFDNRDTCSNYCRGDIRFLLDGTATNANVQDNVVADTVGIFKYETGNFGLSTSSPLSKLTVQGTSGNSDSLLQVASSTGATVFQVNRGGHIQTGGGTPAVSTCGTSPSISGNDTAGTVTVGSGVVTACTITFYLPRTNTPRVVGVVTGGGLNIAGGYSAKSTTAITFSFAATIGGGTFDYLIVE